MPVTNIRDLLQFEHLSQHCLSEQERKRFQEVRQDVSKMEVKPMMVCTFEELEAMEAYLDARQLIGIDIEHYSAKDEAFICLVQIATIERVFILDRFSHIHHHTEAFLNRLFANKDKVKIFHSYENDLRWLCEDYDIWEFQTILDTSKIYGLIENQKGHTPSLKWLAMEFLGLEVKKEYQQSDWRIRPLFAEMADYAATDALVLPYLLLAMLQPFVLDPKQNSHGEALRQLESKRMLKTSRHKHSVRLI
jgi:ribonuclease D